MNDKGWWVFMAVWFIPTGIISFYASRGVTAAFGVAWIFGAAHVASGIMKWYTDHQERMDEIRSRKATGPSVRP